jgi:uncharacterized protein DUF3106
MSLSLLRRSWWAAGLSLSLALCPRLDAQSQTNAGPASSVTNLALSGGPPPLPPAKSPIDFFRELLAIDPEKRAQFLADRPPETQKHILAKVHEYESLSPDDRELRLKATDLRFYLRPLLNSPATNRPMQLALIPERDRELVEVRLWVWDQLSPAQQKELLENESTLQYLTERQSGSQEHQRQVQENLSAPRREQLNHSIVQWQKLPADQRNKIVVRYYQVFELTPAEQQKVLGKLSESERLEMEKSLQKFRSMSLEQRKLCLSSFEKLASLSPDQRLQFLKNAERWKLVTPEQRRAWRNLVRNLPPLPPGFGSGPEPPLPPGLNRLAAPMVTNGN